MAVEAYFYTAIKKQTYLLTLKKFRRYEEVYFISSSNDERLHAVIRPNITERIVQS